MYLFHKDILYRRSYDHMWRRCLSDEEAQKAMEEVHSGVCGAHQSGPKMYHKFKVMGYFWSKMAKDCVEYAKKCHQCQIHGEIPHRPPSPLHPTVPAWPFAAWGTDVIGPIEPPSRRGHRFILAATDYFSRWTEAVPLREVKADNVVGFFEHHIIYRFGVPNRVISDNGPA